jgi:hypothetical protein
MAPPGGKAAFPILPACTAQALKAVIHCLKPRHPTPRLFWRLVLGLPRTCRVDQKMKNPSRADAPEGFADLSIFFPDPNLRAEHLHAYAGRADWRCAHTSARRTTAVGGVRADMRLSTCGVTIPCDTHSISQRENQLPSRVLRHATLGFDERLASVYSAEAIAQRRELAELIRQSRATLAEGKLR